MFLCVWLFVCSSSASSVTNGTIASVEDITVTSNSTQTPCDLSPLPINEDAMLPQAHHQNPGHCIASFAAINQMRQNSQVHLDIFFHRYSGGSSKHEISIRSHLATVIRKKKHLDFVRYYCTIEINEQEHFNLNKK